MGGISAFLAFVGLYALVNDLLGGRSLGETTSAVIFSYVVIILFFWRICYGNRYRIA